MASGKPAFGIADTIASGTACRIAWRMRDNCDGPPPQFTPITVAPA
jgi:hypothetical protein